MRHSGDLDPRIDRGGRLLHGMLCDLVTKVADIRVPFCTCGGWLFAEKR